MRMRGDVGYWDYDNIIIVMGNKIRLVVNSADSLSTIIQIW